MASTKSYRQLVAEAEEGLRQCRAINTNFTPSRSEKIRSEWGELVDRAMEAMWSQGYHRNGETYKINDIVKSPIGGAVMSLCEWDKPIRTVSFDEAKSLAKEWAREDLQYSDKDIRLAALPC